MIFLGEVDFADEFCDIDFRNRVAEALLPQGTLAFGWFITGVAGKFSD